MFCVKVSNIVIITIFRNIVIEDPRPTMQQFFILMEGLEPYFDPEQRRDPGDLNGILFQVPGTINNEDGVEDEDVYSQCLQNITIVAASNAMNEQEVLWGFKEGNIRNLVG